jgi:hypothetical protein
MPTPDPTARRLHLVDLDNLVSGPRHAWRVAPLIDEFIQAVDVSEHDQLVVASDAVLARSGRRDVPPGTVYLVGEGPHGAERRLLEAFPAAQIASHYHELTIGSGDGAFAELARAVVALGLPVTVVSHGSSTARELRRVATRFVELPRRSPRRPRAVPRALGDDTQPPPVMRGGVRRGEEVAAVRAVYSAVAREGSGLSGGDQISITWDELAAAWRIDGSPAGPAGAAHVELGSVSWRFDWLEPSLLVDAYVTVDGDSPDAPIGQGAVDVVARLCGDAAARTLVALPASGARDAVAPLSRSSAPDRTIAGRLAVTLELADATTAPNWWTVEAASAAAALGSVDAAELAGEAFEVIDSVPAALHAPLRRVGLTAPLRAILLGVGLAEADLPEPLRLDHLEVDHWFDDIVGRLDAPPASLPAGFPEPTFRRGGDPSRGPGPGDQPVQWIDVPVPALRRAVWRRSSAGEVEVEVAVEGSVPPWLAVRLVSLDGRAPVAVERARLRPAGTRDGETVLTARFTAVADVAVRVELVDESERAPMTDALRSMRHATNLARSAATSERIADAEARFATSRAPLAVRSAAHLWSAAASAWESAGDTVKTQVCRRHLERLDELVEASQGRRQARPGGPAAAAVAGWAESALAVARTFLADSSTVGGDPGDRALRAVRAAELAALAESVDDLELAARFRAEQARATDAGDGRSAVAALAVRHFDRLGVRPPGGLQPLGAADG